LPKEVADTNQKGTYCPNCGSLNVPGRKNCYNCETTLPKKKWELDNKIALLALLVAVSAIFIGAYQADRTVHANIKPFLDFRIVENSKGEHSIILKNYGLGPAVIEGVHFYKNGKELKDLNSSLANLPSYSTSTIGTHIQKDEEIHLAEIDRYNLERENFSETQIDGFIESFRERLNEITIKIAYEDVLGEHQKALDRPTYFP
jgi:hypothetical protein